MKIAYVTRSHEDAGLQGKLNGGFSIASYLSKEFGIHHVQVPNTSYKGEGTIPELADLECYTAMRQQDWGQYDFVLFGEYAYAPFFDLMGIPASMLVHSLWIWPDGTAHHLGKFLPFVQEAVCPTLEVKGLMESKGIANVWLPYPVPDDYFEPSPFLDYKDRPYDVIWVGRAGQHKNPEMMYRIAEKMPTYKFVAFSSTDLPAGAPPNVEINVRAPRGDCHSTMAKAKVLLMTSGFETYATCLIEGGLSGCSVLALENWGVSHTVPGTTLFKDEDEACMQIATQVATEPQMPRKFWVDGFGASGVRKRWEDYLQSKVAG